MKRHFRFPLVILLVLCPMARADLGSDIRALLADKALGKADVGVMVVRLGDAEGQDQTLFESKSATPRIPASNLKLVTTATAIEKLGAGFQFKTTLADRGPDLAIVGDGDPSFGDAELLKKVGWGIDTVFKAWAENLKKRGITHVRDVYVDDSIFDQEFFHPDWPLAQSQLHYEAQVGGINLNENCVDFYVRTMSEGQLVEYRTEPSTDYISIANTCITGTQNSVWLSRQIGTNNIILRGQTNVSKDVPDSVTIHDPPMFAGTVLVETLAANGIHVEGTVKRDRTIRAELSSSSSSPTTNPAGKWTALAIHTTPLTTVLARANKNSINLYAESMCKRIGAAVSGESGSWENGTAATGAMLRGLGISGDEFNLDDGCGLSKKNLISPNAVVHVLEHEFHGKDWAVYRDSLSIGGKDGTLEDRFRGSDLQGRVLGKSGYVAGVRSLSGVVKAKDGNWYAFSILMNNLPEDGHGQAKLIQERIVAAIDADVSGVPRGKKLGG